MTPSFAEGFASWRRVLASGTASARMVLFVNCAAEVAGYVAHGLGRAEAADALTELALAHGLVAHAGADEVQAIIAEAFETVEPLSEQGAGVVPNRPAQWTNGRGSPASPLVLPRGGFMCDFTPCDYLVDGILQRRFVYALTGQTGHAKSAIALLLAELVASVNPNAMFGRHKVEKGQVAYLVGENPDDIRMRLIGMASLREDDASKDRMFFIPGVFDIEAVFDGLCAEMAHYGHFDLIIVDTSAAYFFGNEELSNTQMGAHARKLRRLTTLPGAPCVLVLCHPIKHVTDPTQLLPRGGGAFLNEVDGNLTAWKHDDVLIELHHNKIRGPGFEPIALRLETIRTPKLTDAKGRMLPTVRAVVITDTDEDLVKNKTRDDEDRAMAIRLKHGETETLSYAQIAEELGWFTADGSPAKMRVMRAHERLERANLFRHERGQWLLTEKGKDAARKAAMRLRALEEGTAKGLN